MCECIICVRVRIGYVSVGSIGPLVASLRPKARHTNASPNMRTRHSEIDTSAHTHIQHTLTYSTHSHTAHNHINTHSHTHAPNIPERVVVGSPVLRSTYPGGEACVAVTAHCGGVEGGRRCPGKRPRTTNHVRCHTTDRH